MFVLRVCMYVWIIIPLQIVFFFYHAKNTFSLWTDLIYYYQWNERWFLNWKLSASFIKNCLFDLVVKRRFYSLSFWFGFWKCLCTGKFPQSGNWQKCKLLLCVFTVAVVVIVVWVITVATTIIVVVVVALVSAIAPLCVYAQSHNPTKRSVCCKTCDSCLLLFWLMCTYRHRIVLPTLAVDGVCAWVNASVRVYACSWSCFILNSNNLTIWHIWHNVAHFLSNSWHAMQFSLLAKRDCLSRKIIWNSNCSHTFDSHCSVTLEVFTIQWNQKVF